MINEILDKCYGSPNHGNKPDPMDELIYIHLSKKTHEAGYARAFENLSKAFPRWKGLAEAEPKRILKLISCAGLGIKRTEELLSNIKEIKKRFKTKTLNPLKNWSERKIFDFLTGLKGIGPKSARCIMMYSLGKEVFPVDTHVHTICERMGFIAEGLNHKVVQEELAEMFPKAYRYSLHVNMVAHGREVCKERGRPRCDMCYLRKFCNRFRREKRKSIKNGPKMIDIFCGSGGASQGFREAGFNVKLAIDMDIAATDTYYLNIPELTFDEVLTGDIRGLSDEFPKESIKGKIDLLIGGPPCQGWSNIGKNWKNGNNGKDFLKDGRNALYTEFVKQLDNFKPKYFIMENVPGLLTAHDGKYKKIIQNEFKKHGYESETTILETSRYGIPQNRARIFFFGRKIDKREKEGTSRKELLEIITAIKKMESGISISFRRAMTGLPHLAPSEGSDVMRLDGMKLQGETIPRPNKGKLVFNHFARPHNKRDLEIYNLIREGENYLEFSKRIGMEELLPYDTKSFNTKFRKINGNRPCFAIISHLHKDANSYIHPEDNRGITVREAARIQTFADDFIFLAKGFRQFIPVGNAVPPRLAEIIGGVMAQIIKKSKNKKTRINITVQGVRI